VHSKDQKSAGNRVFDAYFASCREKEEYASEADTWRKQVAECVDLHQDTAEMALCCTGPENSSKD